MQSSSGWHSARGSLAAFQSLVQSSSIGAVLMGTWWQLFVQPCLSLFPFCMIRTQGMMAACQLTRMAWALTLLAHGNEYACGGYVKICAGGEDWDHLRLDLEWDFCSELNWCDAVQGWIVTMYPMAE